MLTDWFEGSLFASFFISCFFLCFSLCLLTGAYIGDSEEDGWRLWHQGLHRQSGPWPLPRHGPWECGSLCRSCPHPLQPDAQTQVTKHHLPSPDWRSNHHNFMEPSNRNVLCIASCASLKMTLMLFLCTVFNCSSRRFSFLSTVNLLAE